MRRPAPPTLPLPEPSPTVSPSSSVESLFDNVQQKSVTSKNSARNTVRHNLAYSSLPRRLCPLSSELLTFLAKEGLHLDWQIFTMNNRSIECFLYKYMIFINDSDRESLLTGIMLTRILIQIQARDAENEIENVKHVQLGESFDYNLQREAWSVSRTCPIGFGSFSPRRNLLLDFEKIVPHIKGLLLSRGICGLTHLEQTFGQMDKSTELITAAEQHILSGDITVNGLDSLLRLLDGVSQDSAMMEFVKAQEDWEIEGGNVVEPRIIKRSIRTSITVCKAQNISTNGLYQFHQASTKVDLSIKRRFNVKCSPF